MSISCWLGPEDSEICAECSEFKHVCSTSLLIQLTECTFVHQLVLFHAPAASSAHVMCHVLAVESSDSGPRAWAALATERAKWYGDGLRPCGLRRGRRVERRDRGPGQGEAAVSTRSACRGPGPGGAKMSGPGVPMMEACAC
jgi:hypothetical protein